MLLLPRLAIQVKVIGRTAISHQETQKEMSSSELLGPNQWLAFKSITSFETLLGVSTLYKQNSAEKGP
jgi:hypothetical protein